MLQRYPQVYVRAEKANLAKLRHPWIWDRTIIEPTVQLPAGTVVDLVLIDGTWLGRGLYNPASHLRVRIYQWNPTQPLDEQWLLHKLELACRLRDRWQEQHGPLSAVRLVNSEGDGLSGLVIERLGDYGVVQVNAAGIQPWLPTIAQWLSERYQLSGVLQRIDEKIATSEALINERTVLVGSAPTEPIVINEYGVLIGVDLESGQKTGYYLDQRANRFQAAGYSRGQMLDVCTYLGGFALAACRRGEVSKVRAIDMSARALAAAQENARLNQVEQLIEFVQADCFEELQRLRDSGQRFDTIVLDPPRLAGSREHKSAALRAYHQLNLLAIQILNSDGILVTCSCSGRVTKEEFAGTLAAAARRAGRSLQIIEQRGADFDHPWEANCPEGEYLKCIICRCTDS